MLKILIMASYPSLEKLMSYVNQSKLKEKFALILESGKETQSRLSTTPWSQRSSCTLTLESMRLTPCRMLLPTTRSLASPPILSSFSAFLEIALSRRAFMIRLLSSKTPSNSCNLIVSFPCTVKDLSLSQKCSLRILSTVLVVIVISIHGPIVTTSEWTTLPSVS